MLTTGFVLTGQGVHQDVDSARIRHQPGGGQPGEVSSQQWRTFPDQSSYIFKELGGVTGDGGAGQRANL